MSTEKKNVILYILTEALRLSAFVLSAEAILQTFLYSIGFTQNQIYIQSIAYQALNTLIVIVGANFADKGSVFKRAMFTMAATAASTIIFLPLCFSSSIGTLEMVLMLTASAGMAGTPLSICAPADKPSSSVSIITDFSREGKFSTRVSARMPFPEYVGKYSVAAMENRRSASG